jgi:phage tail-like protein
MTVKHDGEFQGSYFGFEMDGVKVGMFTAVSGLSIELAVTEFSTNTEGGTKLAMKRPGRAKYSEVVLKRGFSPNMDIYKWFDDLVKASKLPERKTGAVVVYDRTGKTEMARFNLTAAWPSKLNVSDLSAGGDDVMIEDLTIQHEFLEWA